MKLELRENMYVRTEKGIAKIKKIFPDGSEPYFEAKYETDTYDGLSIVTHEQMKKKAYKVVE